MKIQKPMLVCILVCVPLILVVVANVHRWNSRFPSTYSVSPEAPEDRAADAAQKQMWKYTPAAPVKIPDPFGAAGK